MKKRLMMAIGALGLASSATHAQMTEKVDSTTGNYVPVRDPFLSGDPDPDKANPNRLGNRQSKRNASVAAPRSSASAMNPNDGLTPAQRMAARSANNGRAPAIAMIAPDGSREETTTDGFVSMGGMATYTPPGEDTQPADPFAKPDWWPK